MHGNLKRCRFITVKQKQNNTTMKKITAGHYLLDNGFTICYDATIEGQCKWAIRHVDAAVFARYEEEQYDQLFATLYEAKMYVIDLNLN